MGFTPTPTIPAPVRVMKSDVNVTCNGTGAFADADSDGSAGARPLDIVIPNVEAGQWVRLEPNFQVSSAASPALFDFATIVAGATVNRVSGAAFGVIGWQAPANIVSMVTGGLSYQVVAGDIENGSVRFRLQQFIANGQNRVIGANGGVVAFLEGWGPFP